MRIFKLTILLGLAMLLVVSCSMLQKQKYVTDGDYSFEVFRPLYDSLEVEADLVNLYTEFIENGSDMEVIRRVQGYWIRMDEEASICG